MASSTRTSTDAPIRTTSDAIAAGLERAFAERGFAEPSVNDLRDAAGVSLRTLYKYAPSRERMVRMALEHRQQRYLEHVFADSPPCPGPAALDALIDRVVDWMKRESSHGCLFHAAVAAAPSEEPLRELLASHKNEVARRAARATGLVGRETELGLLIEGLTQAWSLQGEDAVHAARRLGAPLFDDAPD